MKMTIFCWQFYPNFTLFSYDQQTKKHETRYWTVWYLEFLSSQLSRTHFIFVQLKFLTELCAPEWVKTILGHPVCATWHMTPSRPMRSQMRHVVRRHTAQWSRHIASVSERGCRVLYILNWIMQLFANGYLSNFGVLMKNIWGMKCTCSFVSSKGGLFSDQV